MAKILVDPFNLPKGKVKEYRELRESVINASVQYGIFYDKFNDWKCEVDTKEKIEAINFLLGDLLETTKLKFSESIIINKLGDIDKIKSMNYREFKLLQEIISKADIIGRKNHIKVAESMIALNEDGKYLMELEGVSKMFAKEIQDCNNKYNNFCVANNAMPENFDEEIEKRYEEQKALSTEKSLKMLEESESCGESESESTTEIENVSKPKTTKSKK